MGQTPKELSSERKTKKTEVIELLFEDIWPIDAASPKRLPMIVTNDEVAAAINRRNDRHKGKGKALSPNNPANFLKDFIRKKTCNANWPERLREMRITARQRYGNKQVLEFVNYREGDSVPFPDRYDPTPDLSVYPVESLSLPRAARALGRVDEPWLTQVVVYQRIVHQHLAILPRREKVVELSHLQMSVKTQPEIDAIFVATIEVDNAEVRALVTCEAKQFGERILEDQIREQIAQAFSATASLTGAGRIDAIIPIVVKVAPHPQPIDQSNRVVYLAEFELIERGEFEKRFRDALHEMPLTVSSRAYYELFPAVRGISNGLSVVPRRKASTDDDEESNDE